MRRVLLSLVLIGLAAALVQAQTPKVKLVWETNRMDGLIHWDGFALDDAGASPVVTMATGAGVFVFDAQGRKKPFSEVEGIANPVMSADGRYLSVSGMRGKSGLYYLDRLRGIIRQETLVWAKDEVRAQTTWMSPDGQRRIYVRYMTYVPDGGWEWSTRDDPSNMGRWPFDTLVVTDAEGRVFSRQRLDRLYVVKFSPSGDRFYTVHMDSSGRWEHLTCFNRDGKLLWQKKYSREVLVFSQGLDVASDGSVAVVEGRSEGWVCSFYDGKGNIENKVNLHVGDLNNWLAKVHLSSDGSKALVYDGSTIRLVQKSPPKVLWEILKDPHAGQVGPRDIGLFGYIALSKDGKYALAGSALPPLGKIFHCEVTLFDMNGNEIWRKEEFGACRPFFGTGSSYFLVANGVEGGVKLALYQIVQ